MKPRDIDNPTERREEKRKFASKFGDHLGKLRKTKGVSQEKLSLQAGYYHTYVNKIEKGKYSPSLHTVWRLSHTLGLSLSDFFKGF